jgi:hypothetical protein
MKDLEDEITDFSGSVCRRSLTITMQLDFIGPARRLILWLEILKKKKNFEQKNFFFFFFCSVYDLVFLQ